jgi:hypothetical protein
MSTYEDDEPDFGEDDGELDLSGFDSDDDDDDPLGLDDEGDVSDDD